jgi:hypothetical protein
MESRGDRHTGHRKRVGGSVCRLMNAWRDTSLCGKETRGRSVLVGIVANNGGYYTLTHFRSGATLTVWHRADEWRLEAD